MHPSNLVLLVVLVAAVSLVIFFSITTHPRLNARLANLGPAIAATSIICVIIINWIGIRFQEEQAVKASQRADRASVAEAVANQKLDKRLAIQNENSNSMLGVFMKTLTTIAPKNLAPAEKSRLRNAVIEFNAARARAHEASGLETPPPEPISVPPQQILPTSTVSRTAPAALRRSSMSSSPAREFEELNNTVVRPVFVPPTAFVLPATVLPPPAIVPMPATVAPARTLPQPAPPMAPVIVPSSAG